MQSIFIFGRIYVQKLFWLLNVRDAITVVFKNIEIVNINIILRTNIVLVINIVSLIHMKK